MYFENGVSDFGDKRQLLKNKNFVFEIRVW